MPLKATDLVTAFADAKKIAQGTLLDVALVLKKRASKDTRVLVFSDATGEVVDLDLRGTVESISKKLLPTLPKPAGPGRPKLGVVSREVTLLPTQWDWLSSQPGGASVTLRKLVETARKKNSARELVRHAQETAHKFMAAMAGDLEDYEEALRSLYAKDGEKFSKLTRGWPKDVRDYARALASGAFGNP